MNIVDFKGHHVTAEMFNSKNFKNIYDRRKIF